MTYSTENEIRSLIDSFESGTLPRQSWTHAAHLTVALWYLMQNPLTAIDQIRCGIQNYNAAIGIKPTPTGGYHETITLFWIRMVQEFIASVERSVSFCDLARMLINHYSDPKLLFQYYSHDRLFSPQARKIWIEPDLKSIDA